MYRNLTCTLPIPRMTNWRNLIKMMPQNLRWKPSHPSPQCRKNPVCEWLEADHQVFQLSTFVPSWNSPFVATLDFVAQGQHIPPLPDCSRVVPVGAMLPRVAPHIDQHLDSLRALLGLMNLLMPLVFVSRLAHLGAKAVAHACDSRSKASQLSLSWSFGSN